MKSRMRRVWWREVSVRGGRAGWLLANRLQCNLHSYGWISNVGVLYKGIWLPAELHDMQLAPWRVATNTITCNHTDMDVCTDTQRHSVWFICWIIKTSKSPTLSDTLCTPGMLCRSPASPTLTCLSSAAVFQGHEEAWSIGLGSYLT